MKKCLMCLALLASSAAVADNSRFYELKAAFAELEGLPFEDVLPRNHTVTYEGMCFTQAMLGGKYEFESWIEVLLSSDKGGGQFFEDENDALSLYIDNEPATEPDPHNVVRVDLKEHIFHFYKAVEKGGRLFLLKQSVFVEVGLDDDYCWYAIE